MSASHTPARATRARLRVAVMAAVAALALTACGGTSDEGTSTSPSSEATPSPTPTAEPRTPVPAAATVEVSAFEYGYTMSSTEIAAGEVTFELRNDGGTSHDLVLEGGPGGSTAIIGPTETATLTVTLEPGTYVLYCSIGNHRAMGMEIEITVS